QQARPGVPGAELPAEDLVSHLHHPVSFHRALALHPGHRPMPLVAGKGRPWQSQKRQNSYENRRKSRLPHFPFLLSYCLSNRRSWTVRTSPEFTRPTEKMPLLHHRRGRTSVARHRLLSSRVSPTVI